MSRLISELLFACFVHVFSIFRTSLRVYLFSRVPILGGFTGKPKGRPPPPPPPPRPTKKRRGPLFGSPRRRIGDGSGRGGLEPRAAGCRGPATRAAAARGVPGSAAGFGIEPRGRFGRGAAFHTCLFHIHIFVFISFHVC